MLTDVACRRKDCKFNTGGRGCGTCTCTKQVLKINGEGMCLNYKKVVGKFFTKLEETK